jgi:uncharacterized membrane protein
VTDAEPAASTRPSGRLLPKGRFEAFSDGVFAIVVTLLVLELEVPDAGGESLWTEILAGWPAYLGYVVSFAFIGGSWVAHSTLTRFTKAVDAQLMRLNLVLLLLVSFLPFSTSVLARHLDDAGEADAVVLFGANLTLAALLVNVLVAYTIRTPGLVADDAAEAELRAFERERAVAVGVLLAATVAGLFVPVAAVGIFLATSVLILVEPLWRARRSRRAAIGAQAR